MAAMTCGVALASTGVLPFANASADQPTTPLASESITELAAFGWSPSPRGVADRLGAHDSNCERCHQFDHGLSHPVRVVPSMAVPPSFPLESGRVTCLTCHDDRAAQPHGDSSWMGGRSDMMLRGVSVAEIDSPSTLCRECHVGASNWPGAGVSRGADAHAAALTLAHLQRRGSSEPGQAITQASRQLSLDSESMSCISCHDGSVASGVDLGMSRSAAPWTARMASIGRNHPVGIEIKPSRDSVPGSMATRPIEKIDGRLRLFSASQRTIGCGTCHSPYSQEDKLLVMSNRNSMLCLSCHHD